MKKILVAAKDPKVGEDLRKHLDPREYALLPSYDPRNVVASTIKQKPDLIILDLNFPHPWEVETLKKLKESNSNIPVIVIADTSSDLSKIDITKEKAYSFTESPIQPEKLSNMIKQALSRGMSPMTRATASTGREQSELKVVNESSSLSASLEEVGIDCEKSQSGSSAGKGDYDQMFDQFLTPIFGEILANSKGNIYDRLISALEKSLIFLILKYCNHNQVQASQILGISRNTLRERIKRYDLW